MHKMQLYFPDSKEIKNNKFLCLSFFHIFFRYVRRMTLKSL